VAQQEQIRIAAMVGAVGLGVALHSLTCS